MRFDRPDAYWKKDVALFFSRRFALLLKMLYPVAIIVPVAASGMPAKYAAAVIGIVAVMAGTFGAGESLTMDLNDGILVRVALTPLSPYRIVFEVLAVNAVLDLVQLLPALLIVYVLHPVSDSLDARGHYRRLRYARNRELHRYFYRQLHLIARRRAVVRDGYFVPPDLRLWLLPQPAPDWHHGDAARPSSPSPTRTTP